MTSVTFLTEGNRIIGFDATGHSGYGQEGEDIVCAAVTSAVRLVEATVNDVMGLCASVKVCEKVARYRNGRADHLRLRQDAEFYIVFNRCLERL